jgi:enoyl-CoA hydratase/carnithine racemase
MATDLIELQVDAGVATLSLNRPDKRNAINDDLRTQLAQVLEHVRADPQVRALVLTGNGKAFCAGGDIEGMAARLKLPPGEVAFRGWSRQQQVHHVQTLLHTLPIPTIAAVNGPAAGLGADTALACDFIVASRAASFTWSYIHRGLVPDGGAMYFLPRRVGLPRAKELIFSGRKVEPEEALQLGIADLLSAPESLLADARAFAARLSTGSRTALALGKTLLKQSFELTSEEVFARGSQAQAICYTSAEHRASVEDFLSKAATRQDKSKG